MSFGVTRRGLVRSAGVGVAGGLATTAYAAWEARRYVLRERVLRVLPPGARPLRVLHLTDLHLTPGQTRKRAWLSGLGALAPTLDLVVDTGDNLAHRDAVPVVRESLGPLLDVPGVFVHGSNDYFEPGFRNPFRYLLPDDGRRHTDVPPLPWRDLSRSFTERGWLDLTNTLGRLRVGELDVAFAGVDDPHLGYDRLDAVAGRADPAADLRLGITHAPYLRVLDAFARDGYDAVLAGHTHGGQVCLPGGRALTTNCDLDTARARGVHRHPAASRPGDPGSTWLHVGAGLGTSPYARIRIACRPEAVLLTLVPIGEP
jgi:predicted MPP superfamily phosphohydrolase